MIQAKDIMSEQLIVVHDDMFVHQTAHLMLRDRVSSFPVVSRKNEGVVGIVTMTDLFHVITDAVRFSTNHNYREKIKMLKEMPVALIMSRQVIAIHPETTLDEIVSHVVDRGIHSFPVMQDGKMVGIVSRHDILNAVFVYD